MALSGVETLSAAAAARPPVDSLPEAPMVVAPFVTAAAPGGRVVDDMPASAKSTEKPGLWISQSLIQLFRQGTGGGRMLPV